MKSFLAAVCLAIVLVQPAIAVADDPYSSEEPEWKIQQRRKVLFQEGQKLVDKEQWKEALDKFREVQRLKSHPRVMLWMALCEDRLGNMLKARAIYEQAQADAREGKLEDVDGDATKALSDL